MTAVITLDEFDALLERAGKRGYLWYLFRADRHGPEILAGVFHWPGCADVFVLTDHARAHAYRTPADATTDVFTPGDVLWWYQSSPVWTLRALLTLPQPNHLDTPTTLAPSPPDSGVPGDRLPVRLRKRGH